MKFLRIALAWLALCGTAYAQAQIGSGQVWGNSTASRAPGKSETVTAILDRALGSTRGSILMRGAATWGLVTPATAGLPWVSSGAGADASYQRLGLNGLPQGIANSILINPTGSLADYQNVAVPSCSNDGAHALTYTNGSGLVCTTLSTSISLSGDGGVVTGTGAAITGTGTVYAENVEPGGRITLTPSVPYMIADATAQQNVYYAPAKSRWVPIYNGTVMRLYNFTASDSDTVGLTLNIAGSANWVSGSLYDFFVINDSGTIRLATGPAWTSVTARGTGATTTELEIFRGLLTNKVSMTARYAAASTTTVAAHQGTYVGTCLMTANGQTGMQFKPAPAASGNNSVLGCWNRYNRKRVCSQNSDSATSYTYSSTTWRQMNNGAGGNVKIRFVDGYAESPVDTETGMALQPAGGGGGGSVGINIDSTSGPPPIVGGIFGTSNAFDTTVTPGDTFLPSLGLRTAYGLEAAASGTSTVFFWSGFNSPNGQTSYIRICLEM